MLASTPAGGADEAAPVSVNAFLIDTHAKIVLVDAGAGTLLGAGVGKLIVNLRAAGYNPDQVDAIYITHVRPDHVGGLVAQRRATFPNATVHAGRDDADYWLKRSTLERCLLSSDSSLPRFGRC